MLLDAFKAITDGGQAGVLIIFDRCSLWDCSMSEV